MEHESDIIIKKRGSIMVFEIKGDVTSASEPLFNQAYENADFCKTEKILLIFDGDAYINSGGIALLIQLLAETNSNRQQIGITGLSEHFKKIFRMVGIPKFARIYSSVDEAMEGLSGS